MPNTDILRHITSVGRKILPTGCKMWLYGSRARGDARPVSDWDVLVLLDKSKIENSDYDKYAFPLNQIGWTTDAVINPVLYTLQEWKNNAATLFYKNVERDKIELI